MSLAQLLNDRRDEIVAAFVRKAQSKDIVPANVSRSSLVDHIPNFLTEMASELERLAGPRNSQDAIDVKASAREHGQQRWHLGYELSWISSVSWTIFCTAWRHQRLP